MVIAALFAAFLLPSCSMDRRVPSGRSLEIAYRGDDQAEAFLHNGIAYPPEGAPPEVRRAISAANRIAGLPYKWGGGHARLDDNGYDC